jgi:four helix bundle protein
MRNFKKLTIWQESMNIVKKVYELSNFLPKEENYGIKSQIQRAAVSVPSNIAEGCSRNSEIEFKRFWEISIGSAFELETQLIINEIYLSDDTHLKDLMIKINGLQKMINNLITKIKEHN